MIERAFKTAFSIPSSKFFSPIFATFASILLSASLFGQEGVTVTMTPETPTRDGQEITLTIEHECPEDVLAVSYTIAYEGFLIMESSTPETFFDPYDSWFANDQNFTSSISFNNSLQEIYITLERTDENPRSGEGFSISGGGLIAEVEDIIMKKEVPASMKVVKVETRRLAPGSKLPRIDLSYDPLSASALLFPETGVVISRVRVLSLNGSVLAQDASGRHEIALPQVPAGLYIFDIETATGQRIRKKLYKN